MNCFVYREKKQVALFEGLFENELPLASIKQLKLMVRKAN